MNNDVIKERLLQTGWELMQAKKTVEQLTKRYDELFAQAQQQEELQPRFHTIAGEIGANKPAPKKTELVLGALPQDGSPMALKTLAQRVGQRPRLVSATCSNLQRKGRVVSADRGMWKLVVKQP